MCQSVRVRGSLAAQRRQQTNDAIGSLAALTFCGEDGAFSAHISPLRTAASAPAVAPDHWYRPVTIAGNAPLPRSALVLLPDRDPGPSPRRSPGGSCGYPGLVTDVSPSVSCVPGKPESTYGHRRPLVTETASDG